MSLLEPRRQEGKIEASPFVDAPPAPREHAHHWVAPDVVAEIEFDDRSRARTVKNAPLRGVAQRSIFRHANWVTPPESP
jgi:hypothetical protein